MGLRNEALAWLDSIENPDWDIVYEAPFGEITAGDMFVSWVTHDLAAFKTVHRTPAILPG